MKKKSFIQTITILMSIQVLIVTLIVILFAVYSYQSTMREMNSVAENFLDVYAAQIENRIRKIEQNLIIILSNTTDLGLFESSEEAERNYASVRLYNTIQNLMLIDNSAEMFVIAETEYDTCLNANRGSLSLEMKNQISEFVMEYARKGEWDGTWKFETIGDTVYLYKVFGWKQRVLAAFISADTLLATIPVQINNCSFVLTDGTDKIWGYSGYEIFDEEIGIQLQELTSSRMIIDRISVIDGQINLHLFERKSDVFRWRQNGAVLLLCIIILLCIFDFVFSGIIRKDLILPMNEMRRDMKHIEEGEYNLRIQETGDSQEFFMLAQSFNKLMDEILNLRIQFYEKELEISDAEQKYIRLQIRPHFFLNALTTITSLSSQKKNADIEAYINALSKNIRYMFSSGLHTVTLKEEIRHVENYFEMQELKYPGCVFYYIDLPEELEEWRIPQMLIHTLIENEYKYAVSMDGYLMILIKASMEMHDGEKMLMIEVEDDGQGYPEDVLEYINQDKEKSQDGTRVGLWSIKRLLELMYDRKHLLQLEKAFECSMQGIPVLQMKVMEEYLEQHDKKNFMDYLKKELDGKVRQRVLDGEMLKSIYQEVQQVVYAHLAKKGIQISLLLGNDMSVKLSEKADQSVVDMMRWENYLLERVFEYEEEVQKSQTIIERINNYIHEHYKENIGRNEIGAEFFLVPEYLAKMYKKKTGQNLKDYINEYRLQQAKILLNNQEMKVSDAALEVGFDNFSYFSTLFKKEYGMTPNEYRKGQFD